jgi:hypothetical protein
VLADLERGAPGARLLVLQPAADAPQAGPDAARWTAAGRIVVLTGPAFAGGAEVARQFTDLRTAPVLVADGLSETDAARAREALARLAFDASANDGARQATAARYLLHTLMNVPRLARESRAEALTGLCARIPAVVVAAGPSLDRNVHDLAVVRDRPVVIACDTAARPLLSVGVEPDLIVATDSSRANAAHLSSLPASQSWLVAEGSLHPSAFTHFDGRTFVFRVADHQPWPWLRTTGLDAAMLATWGSVATSAFTVALALGCDPIAFIGADFAFTGGRPYCRGTSFESTWASWTAGGRTFDEVSRALVDRWPQMSAADTSGIPVRTAPHLLSFRDWMVDRAAAHPDRQIVNATGAGVLAGPAIAQRTLTDTLQDAPVLERALLHRVLHMAHRSRRGDMAAVLPGVAALLSGADEQAVTAMLEFGAPSVTRASLERALTSPELTAWLLGCRHHLRETAS